MARVLLIEDDPGVREALRLGLELEGHVVLGRPAAPKGCAG